MIPSPLQTETRRLFLQQTGYGLGAAALSSLVNADSPEAVNETPELSGLHHAPRAKQVIYIHLVGSPSHLDLFDYKPELQKRTGQLCPDEFFDTNKLAFIREQPNLLGTPKEDQFAFRKCGASGIELSNLLPHLQGVADELCLIKTLHTDQFNHAPSQMFLLTGFERFGRPSMGSWISYGLGSENQNLPGFVVLVTGQVLGAGNSAFGSGFLPTVHQGVEFRSQGDPVLYLSNPKGVSPRERKMVVDAVNDLNRVALADVGDPEISTRISQYEMAYRMQTSAPELMDLKHESQRTLDLYGGRPGESSFAANCLLARRLVERGVRFVQLYHSNWDSHGGPGETLADDFAKVCKSADQASAALVLDLKERGMLDDTLVIWGGEFGRTPMGENRKTTGRDHHIDAFTMWMAGAGLKKGHIHGETDELGFGVVNGKVHVHDLHATLLHLLGFDHERLTYRFQGRDFRLTDVHGRVVKEILA